MESSLESSLEFYGGGVVVTIPGSGALCIRLRRLKEHDVIVLHGWDADSRGYPGPVEEAVLRLMRDPSTVPEQILCPGWILAGINGDEVDGSDFGGTVAQIRAAGGRPEGRVLRFERPRASGRVAALYGLAPRPTLVQEPGRPGAARGRAHKARKAPRRAPAAAAAEAVTPRAPSIEECFAKVLGADVVDMGELRQLSAQGIPEDVGVRALAWRLLLGFLPRRRADWKAHCEEQRRLYRSFLAEVRPAVEGAMRGRAGGEGDRKADQKDEALSETAAGDTSGASAMADADEVLLEDIVKDVVRTYPDLHFYSGSMRHPVGTPEAFQDVSRQFLRSVIAFGDGAEAEAEGDGRGEATHYAALARILFVYAKLNQGIRYVQGMNEVLGTLYYVLASDGCREWSAHAESDAFFCFNNLMADCRDLFTEDLDRSDEGIVGKMERLSRLLRATDPLLAAHLFSRLRIDPHLFALRWFTTLLCREFPLPDTIRLWDFLLSEEGSGRRIERVCFLCLAMIIEQRDTLLREDFAGCIHVLQRYPPEDVQLLLDRSCALWDRVRGGGGAAPAPGVKEKAIANLAQVAEAWASAGKSMAAGAAGAWEALEGAADSAAESVLGLGPGTPR